MGGGLFKSKKVILTSLIILLITLLIGVTYAYWQTTFTQVDANKLASDCFKLEFSEGNNIDLEEAIPILNSEGEKLTPYTLTIKNICDAETKYQVNLEVLDNELASKYIALKVNSEDSKLLSEYTTSDGILEDHAESYKIAEGHLRKDQVINFEVRLWMDESVTIEVAEATMNKIFESKITVEAAVEKTEGKYKEDILNGADPVLDEKLIPVVVDDKGEVTRADLNQKWYNYSNQEWANAVILNDNVETPKVGATINENDIESYFVWIPRYRYKIFSDEKYDKLSEEIEDRVQTIQVVFENKDTEKSEGNTKGKWLTHPAFTAFNTNGIWVGKFETGYKGANSKEEAQKNPTDENDAIEEAKNVIIKPNVYSWRGIQVSRAYIVGRNYEEELNSHMMKNTEWGAVAYLSQSIYGSRQEVRINNNESYLTGYAAKNAPTTGNTGTNEPCTTYPKACNEYGGATKGSDGEVNVNYFNSASVVASTTNNYSGIFDMSGGTWEYVMAGMEDSLDSNKLASGLNSSNNSGFNGKNTDNSEVKDGIALPEDSRYYDIYPYNTNGNDYTKFILGDATNEMGPFRSIEYIGTTAEAKPYSRLIGSWYSDGAWPMYSDALWVNRGGISWNGTDAGLFYFSRDSGAAAVYFGFRLVLVF